MCVLLGGAQLFVVDLQDAPQLEILQQLFEFFSHRDSVFVSSSRK